MRGARGSVAILACLAAISGGCQTQQTQRTETSQPGEPTGIADKTPEIVYLPEAYERYFAKGGNAVWVDVRDPDEYKAGHIKGAINIPLGSLVRNLDQIPTDRIIVLYCESPVRGVRCTAGISAGRILMEYGYSPGRIKVFEDGPDAWRRARHPMASSR